MMVRRNCLCLLVLLTCIGLWLTGETIAQVAQDDDIADVPGKLTFAGCDKYKRYYLIGAGEQIKAPKEGFGLVIVLPGRDGGARFTSFVKRIYKYSLSEEYLVAQLVAVKWVPRQGIVWPTEKTKVDKQEFSTEEFVEAVVEDMRAKYKLDEQRIFTLSWDSGGPAGYAVSLQKEKSVTGSYIAMSKFKPEELEPLEQAAGHCYFIDHSPDDKVTPFEMAKEAYGTLREYGARTEMVAYKGGHGWKGAVYIRIRKGIRWLEFATDKRAQEKKSVQTQAKP
ncbi:MAG: alpha/beta hydrolase [Planctomycetota bacterium]|jgi:predicted esterase